MIGILEEIIARDAMAWRSAERFVSQHSHDRDALAAERRARFKLATSSATAPERQYHQQRLDAFDQALSEAGITIEGD